MAGVSSVLEAVDVQADGRSQVHEIHTDQAGVTHDRFYLAEAADDLAAAMAAYGAALAARLEADEIAANVGAVLAQGAGAVFSFRYSIAAQAVAAARAAFPTLGDRQAAMAADFLAGQTDDQLKTIFAFTDDQVAALRALPTLAEQAAAISAVVVGA